ncbi:hypothetical protein MIMGU_mgv1a012060mg [Erythranthe guttata]|uniref:Uncharacterized protein n=1 Tax=Erythranthe guttata TaxID=4155 RepID=A0A022RSF9_ERYGU|nr:PREDICTED: uncharacterized protein LOC105952118 [Erythranthe guttata]XP_012831087.1 PREDICTED: uncharacterized protein LOC105952118 [Erythranthe guttata]XP_012831088.1 PREDICTED: uncharacterized protein LOC105952118 [Erythranthe guttata]EYU42713.1 hypothetical protein MIMGU_mgv1a012060mg [Erythranthe guttata]|eukprot:XP_012831086.1 PREDICTED: uncharacterized protein LOC105952118 [Erythranthe guttata]
MADNQFTSTARFELPIGVDSLPAISGIPTSANVAKETHRMIQIHAAQAMSNGASMDLSAYGDSIVRHFKVVGSSSGMLTNDNIANVMQKLTDKITQQISAGQKDLEKNLEQGFQSHKRDIQNDLQNLRQEVLLLRQDVQGLSAHYNAMNARLYNSRFAESGKVQYQTVVKLTPGHPFPNPPTFQNFQLATSYSVNAHPPIGLLPTNRDMLRDMIIGQLHEIRPRMRAIFWFYNDSRLSLDENAHLGGCNSFLVALEDFLKLS